jgi:hypothetical protein
MGRYSPTPRPLYPPEEQPPVHTGQRVGPRAGLDPKSDPHVTSPLGTVWARSDARAKLLFSNHWVNPATSSPADDVRHYVIPPKLVLTNIFYFQQTSGIHAPVGQRKGCSLSGRIPAPIADSSNVATIAREHSVLNLREINRNNTHTALASVLTYYGWVSLIV